MGAPSAAARVGASTPNSPPSVTATPPGATRSAHLRRAMANDDAPAAVKETAVKEMAVERDGAQNPNPWHVRDFSARFLAPPTRATTNAPAPREGGARREGARPRTGALLGVVGEEACISGVGASRRAAAALGARLSSRGVTHHCRTGRWRRTSGKTGNRCTSAVSTSNTKRQGCSKSPP